jgi:lipopolysaccharide/colanic/teichoic acid biosynthesis glycosyltransferase
MKLTAFFLTALERTTALLALVVFLPSLLTMAFCLLIIAGRPIILRDTVALRDGTIAHSHRFRSTGAATLGFHQLGRWMRQTRFDELPALWSVARGDISLQDAWRYCWGRGTHRT